MAVLGLRCCTGFSLVVSSGAPSSSRGARASHCHGLLFGARAPGHAGLSSCGTWAQSLPLPDAEHRPSRCDTQAQLLHACGILPDQGSNPCLLHWQVDFFLTTEPPENCSHVESNANFQPPCLPLCLPHSLVVCNGLLGGPSA